MQNQNLVLMFPGQGSQFIGMGKDLENEFPSFSSTLDEASEALSINMRELCQEDKEGKLNLTEFTQPAILCVSYGIFKILKTELGIKPNLVLGHSLGEYSALVALGALKFSDALKAVNLRGKAMQRAVPVGLGSMAAYLGQATHEIEEICKAASIHEERVEIANYNCPGQLVLSGHKNSVDKACQMITEKKLGRAKTLPVSAPFHSSLMKPAVEEMRNVFKTIELSSFEGSIIANIDAKIHDASTYNKEILLKQINHPVLWTQSLLKASEEATGSLLVEVGPGKVLQGLAKKTIQNECLITYDNQNLKETISKLKSMFAK